MLAPGAGAVLVHAGKGRIAGLTPVKGVPPASLHNRLVAPSSSSSLSATGNLDYHGGPVLHGSTPYLIFWDPHSELTSADKTLFERYFADAAADSGKPSNVFGVARQYTDSSGFADYKHVWSLSHAISDAQPYPTSGQCHEHAGGFTENTCLFDTQLQAEVSRLRLADALPSGTTGNAPIYFVVTPPDVNSCFDDGTTVGTTCADNFFCAYHSNFTDGGHDVLYADIPTLLAKNDPKGCQADGNSTVQAPNADGTVDTAISSMSHEDNETITDPLGTGWFDQVTGNENGDNCAFTGAFSPGAGSNPNAFAPTLGGSASTGTLFDQLINGNKYYTQSEWSNGDINCKLRPAPSAINAQFSAPAGAPLGTTVAFDTSASSSAAGFTSTTWDFGDGSTSFSRSAPTLRMHTYPTAGTYTVTLTLVDTHGNLSTFSQTLKIKNGPIAAFSSSPVHPVASSSVSFDASGSSDSTGVLSSYKWDFGDGSSPTTTSTPTTTHAFAAGGTYTVTLTVSDGTNTDVQTHAVKVDSPPVAAFSVASAGPVAGSPAAFDASASNEPGGSISSFSWDFGDGSTGSGATPSHTYAAPGTYTVALTVTDQDGHTNTISHLVAIGSPPVAAFAVTTPTPTAGSPVAFDGSSSNEPGGTIASYHWTFGDGSSGSGVAPTHTYAAAGSRVVALTVTDAHGHSATTSHAVSVRSTPTAVVTVGSGTQLAGVPVSLSGAASTDVGSAISSYSWQFGDGAVGSGEALSHSYSKPGTYTVTLTVTDALGARSTTTKAVLVNNPAITAVSVKKGRLAERLTLTISGPGTLQLGSKKFNVRRAGKFVVTVKLSSRQIASLRAHHSVTLRLNLKFVPRFGNASSRKVTIKIKG